MRTLFTAALTLYPFATIVAFPVQARLYEPDAIVVLPGTKNGPPGECGVQADYELSGSIMRVELSGAPSASGVRIYIRAYMPSSVGPAMRDLWLKTTTLFTLGNFKPARDNAQGILETSGEIDTASGAKTLREIADGDAEISLIFDGVLPASRLAIGLPTPLPPEVAATLNDCAAAFEKPR
ncbi:MAG: hypothetical protein ABL893_12790 [Hyphomicrobium sp.]|nr:hypothetical protein [Hyphomicrobium sp.]